MGYTYSIKDGKDEALNCFYLNRLSYLNKKIDLYWGIQGFKIIQIT